MRTVLRKSLKASHAARADGMVLCTRDLIVISADRLCSRFLGVRKQDMIGKRIDDLVSLDKDSFPDPAWDYRRLENGMQAKGIRIQTPAGEVVTIDFCVKPAEEELFLIYFNKSNDQKSLFSNVYDLTNSIRKSKIEAIFRETSDHQIIYCNEAMIQMFGYESYENMHSFFDSNVFAEDGERLWLLNMLMAEGHLTDKRVLYKRYDQTNFWGLLNCRIIDKDGSQFFDGVIIDITEQLKREELLRERADALEKANNELDRFIYSASHDIRAPISSMRGLVNLMNMGSDPGTYTRMLEISLNKLDNFVNELTLFSQNKRQRITSEEVYFQQVIDNTILKMKDMPGFRHVKVETELNLEAHFFSDLFRIELILEQIIKNSYEFHDPGKATPFIHIQIRAMDDKAVIEIFDNGSGIPKAHIGRVFEMFYRASNQSKGAGIGLYITREAITLLKGTISVSSEFGVGTTIRIELPNAVKGQLIARKNSLKSQRHSG
jgi:PAS domain S-box-containing protein